MSYYCCGKLLSHFMGDDLYYCEECQRYYTFEDEKRYEVVMFPERQTTPKKMGYVEEEK